MCKAKMFMVTSALLALSTVFSGCADTRGSSAATHAGDANITAAVRSAIAQRQDLGGPNQLYVSTRDHVVYLSGTVSSGLFSEDAEEVARQVPGVTQFVNTVAVSR